MTFTVVGNAASTREHGVDETTTPQIRIDDRADFNSNRRFYHWTYRVLYIRMLLPLGYSISVFMARSSLTYAGIFLTGFLPVPDMLCMDERPNGQEASQAEACSIQIGGKRRMAYNNGREDRKWRIWKEAEEDK